MRTIKAGVIAAAVGLTGLWAAPAGAQTINAVMHAPLRALDPVISTAYILRNYAYMVYDTLLAQDVDGKIQPQMASWEVSEDGTAYTFTLRDGLKWHDGKPVTAADCVASLKRWSQVDKTGQLMASMLADMTPLDDKRFVMKFKTKTAIALQALAKPSGLAPFMMPKAVAETPVGTPITSTIGSGPFVFNNAEYKPGVQAVFDKFADYVPRSEPASGLAGGKVVKVERVKWITMPDGMTAVNALMSNEIDFIEQLPQDLLPLLQGNPDFVQSVYKKQGSQSLARLNFLHPPFDNPKIRQAALLALGQQDLLDAQLGAGSKMGQKCAAVLGCGSAYADEYGGDRVTDPHPEEARALLKEAGYDNKPVLLLAATDLGNLIPMGPVYAQQLRNAGFNVNLQAMDWASVVSRRASKEPPDKGGWNIFGTTNVLPDVADPLGFIGVAAGGSSAWFGWPDVPAIEKARADLASTSDPAEARKLASEIQKQVIDNVVMIPMGQFFNVTMKSKRLDGQLDAPVPVFWNMTKSGN